MPQRKRGRPPKEKETPGEKPVAKERKEVHATVIDTSPSLPRPVFRMPFGVSPPKPKKTSSIIDSSLGDSDSEEDQVSIQETAFPKASDQTKPRYSPVTQTRGGSTKNATGSTISPAAPHALLKLSGPSEPEQSGGAECRKLAAGLRPGERISPAALRALRATAVTATASYLQDPVVRPDLAQRSTSAAIAAQPEVIDLT